MKEVEIFTDGACRKNPGPGGWGALLRCGKHEKELYGYEKNTTNNRMELLAAIKAIQELKTSCNIRITTDSEYLRKGITQWIESWKIRDWKTSNKKPVKNKDLWQQLDNEIKKHKISWFWIKGHSGHKENEIADQLANRAIDEKL